MFAPMSKARISQPDKNAMQSGKAKAGVWILQFVPENPYVVDDLMGWNGMRDTNRELTLRFASKEAAIAYATKQRLEFEVIEPNARNQRRRAYADNFAFNRVRA